MLSPIRSFLLESFFLKKTNTSSIGSYDANGKFEYQEQLLQEANTRNNFYKRPTPVIAMSLNWIEENKDLYKDFVSLTSVLDDSNVDINGGILLQAYEILKKNESEENSKIKTLSSILLCFLLSYYYDDLNNIQYMIEFANRICPNSSIAETYTSEEEMWKILIRSISLGKLTTATSVLAKFLENIDESTKQHRYYNMLLRLIEYYPIPSIEEGNSEQVLKNWKTLVSEFYLHVTEEQGDNIHALFYLAIGILNGNESCILRINEVTDVDMQHWAPIFLSFFMYYIPSMTLVEEYLKKSQNIETPIIYNDIFNKNHNKLITYITIIIDLDNVVGFSLIEILERLNILHLDEDFTNLIYDTWYEQIMDYTITDEKSILLNEVSILLKIVCQSSLSMSKKKRFIENITDKFILSENQVLISMNNNDVEYLIGLFSKFRMLQSCKNLYTKLGLALINNISLNIDDDSGEPVTCIGTRTILNGLSILSKALDYETEESFMKSSMENDVLSILVGKCDIILECSLKRYLSSKEGEDPFKLFVEEYGNMNNLLKQSFVIFIIVKELEKTFKEIEANSESVTSCVKAMKYLIELLKFTHIKKEFKSIFVLYFLNPLVEKIKEMQSKGVDIEGFEGILYEVLDQVNALSFKYEKEIDLQKYINNITSQYKVKDQGESIQMVTKTILDLLLVL